MISNLLMVFFTLGMAHTAFAETLEFPAESIKELYVNNQAGQITIAATDLEKATVSFDNRSTDSLCDISAEMNGSTLETRVITKKDQRSFWKFFGSSECKADLLIMIPQNIAVDLVNGSGDVTIKGINGKVDFKIGSGNLDIDSDVNQLTGKAGAGNVDVKGLTGNVDVKVGSGNIALTYKEKIEKGEVLLKAGSGNIDLFFPKNMKILTHFSSGSGRIKNELGETTSSQFSVSAKVGSGSMNIKKL